MCLIHYGPRPCLLGCCPPLPPLPSASFPCQQKGRRWCLSSLSVTGTRAVSPRALQADRVHLTGPGRMRLADGPSGCLCRWQIPGGRGSGRHRAPLVRCLCLSRCSPSGSLGSHRRQPPLPPHQGQEEGGWLKDECIAVIGKVFLLRNSKTSN